MKAPRFDPEGHVLVLALSVAALVLSFILDVRGGRVEAGGAPLPPLGMCLTRDLLDFDCPGCGLTRSFVALAHGRWRHAFDFHALGPTLFVLAFLQVPYRLYRLAVRRPFGRRERRWLGGFGWGMTVLIVTVWGARLLWP